MALPVEVKRGDQTLTFQAKLRYSVGPRLVEDSAAAPRAVRIRNGILHGVVDGRPVPGEPCLGLCDRTRTPK